MQHTCNRTTSSQTSQFLLRCCLQDLQEGQQDAQPTVSASLDVKALHKDPLHSTDTGGPKGIG